MNLNKITILITDDDDDDKMLLLDALTESGVNRQNVVLTSDGEELLRILPLHASGPCIIFLDLNMPRMNGHAALEKIKSDETLRHIPVIIFTTSNAADDILATYKMGSNSYFTKPSYYRELVDLVTLIKKYWFENAVLVARN